MIRIPLSWWLSNTFHWKKASLRSHIN